MYWRWIVRWHNLTVNKCNDYITTCHWILFYVDPFLCWFNLNGRAIVINLNLKMAEVKSWSVGLTGVWFSPGWWWACFTKDSGQQPPLIYLDSIAHPWHWVASGQFQRYGCDNWTQNESQNHKKAASRSQLNVTTEQLETDWGPFKTFLR